MEVMILSNIAVMNLIPDHITSEKENRLSSGCWSASRTPDISLLGDYKVLSRVLSACVIFSVCGCNAAYSTIPKLQLSRKNTPANSQIFKSLI
jgi:hypothetical protein